MYRATSRLPLKPEKEKLQMRRNIDVDDNDEPAARFSSEYHYITAEVKVTHNTTATATIYRKTAVQPEVRTRGIVLFNESNGGTHYPLRFVHDRTFTTALTLRPGDKIFVERGRFGTMPGQKETELLVKKFIKL
jgi:hypothetical protein